MPLAGGLMLHGYQCGMLWGGALAGGAQVYRLYGTGPQAETMAIIAAQKLKDSFSDYNNGEINCLEISELNLQGKIQLKPNMLQVVQAAVRQLRYQLVWL